jgi:UDP-glucose 4-epimerase
VRDVVRALVSLARHPESPGRVYNIGSTEEVSIRELAERVKAITQSDSPIVDVPYAEAYAPGFEDMQRRVPDISRLHTLIGWQPQHTLDEILRSVVAYEQTRGS